MHNKQHPPATLAWTVWGLGAALYLFGFFQRVAPGVMTEELAFDFNLGAAALGNLSAFYFYSYVAMQIPTGILADIWGPRRLLTAGAFVATIGTLLFAVADNAYVAGIGRLLIGGSVAVAFVGMIKIASHWFAPRHFALATGLALFIGIVGAVFAGVPLQILVEAYGWRWIMGLSAGFSLLISIAIWLIVRDDPTEKGFASYVEDEHKSDTNPWKAAATGLVSVIRYSNILILALVPSGIVGSVLAFAGLWGVPFLTSHHQLSAADAAAVCSAMLIAWALSGPLFGGFSDKYGRRKPLYLIGCVIVATGWTLIYLIPGINTTLLIAILLINGFASGCMIIGFAFGKESVPINLAGTAAGIVNMGVMMGPMLMQPAVGWLLDRGWSGELVNGVKFYSLDAFQSGFALMSAWTCLSLVAIFFARETWCKPAVTTG